MNIKKLNTERVLLLFPVSTVVWDLPGGVWDVLGGGGGGLVPEERPQGRRQGTTLSHYTLGKHI